MGVDRGADVPAAQQVNSWTSAFNAALLAWCETHKLTLSARSVRAVGACTGRSKALFAFHPHRDSLLRYGPAANESGNCAFNRRTQLSSHIRPDRALRTFMYTMFLWNSRGKAAAMAAAPLSDAQRTLLERLFVRHAALPLHKALPAVLHITCTVHHPCAA